MSRRNDHTKQHACDRWMDHLAASNEASLPFDFKLHMKTCETCSEEWYGLRIVWEALALNAEQVTVPDGLKSEVMKAIFKEDASKSDTPFVTSVTKRTAWKRRPFLLAAGFCVFLLAGWSVWRLELPAWKLSSVASTVSTQTVLKEWSLTAAQPALGAAKGSIQLLREGAQGKVVVHTEGLIPTTDDQAYQVWLLYEGNRYNCGTFRVDETGKGSLVYNLKHPDMKIDGFGITLEPDALGTKPRGKKVLGTVQQS